MKTCKVEGCNNKHCANGYCRKHYTQIRRNGEVSNRTYKDPNEIVIYDDYAEIILMNKNREECGRAIIDLDDINKVKDIKWHFNNTGYARNTKIGLLHRFITDCPEGMEVDHINGNRLDNRKSNLRIVTHQQNNMNKSVTKSNTSGYAGVRWSKEVNKWIAQIRVNYKTIHLGCYDNKEDAIEVRKQAEIKYFGEYRNKEYKD